MSSIAVGIDLGTTHTALCVATEHQGVITNQVVPLAQLAGPDSLESHPLLPSCVYFGHDTEPPLALPWDASRRFAVGRFAERRGAETPGRVVSSAKSWLVHPSVDRRSNLLPLTASDDLEKISPVEATFRILEHVVESFNHSPFGERLGRLEELPVTLTVPASFDAAARDLTVEAALAAGLSELTLLEEPQAALYAWLSKLGSRFSEYLKPGDVVLVIDVGGGTTDFSAISVTEQEGCLALSRIAVGDHILLGGDNMDLLLGLQLKKQLEAEGHQLDAWQLQSLVYAARRGKEQLLSDPTQSRVHVAAAGRGSQLFGQTLRAELERELVLGLLVDGYFPEVPSNATPAIRTRSALTRIGLPYAADPGITRHLAAFLRRQAGALETTSSEEARRSLLTPTKLLLNGGVLKSPVFTERLRSVLDGWLRAEGAAPASLLPGEDLDLAVAQGAAYFGLVEQGHGLRIRGGTARAYYVGIESPLPAVPGFEPPPSALCVAPFEMQEGTEVELQASSVGIVVGETVNFRFFGSTTRREDPAGHVLDDALAAGLEELSPIEVTLPAEGRPEGDIVPVLLRARVTNIGTLELEAVPLEPAIAGEKWKVELSVRSESGTPQP